MQSLYAINYDSDVSKFYIAMTKKLLFSGFFFNSNQASYVFRSLFLKECRATALILIYGCSNHIQSWKVFQIILISDRQPESLKQDIKVLKTFLTSAFLSCVGSDPYKNQRLLERNLHLLKDYLFKGVTPIWATHSVHH